MQLMKCCAKDSADALGLSPKGTWSKSRGFLSRQLVTTWNGFRPMDHWLNYYMQNPVKKELNFSSS